MVGRLPFQLEATFMHLPSMDPRDAVLPGRGYQEGNIPISNQAIYNLSYMQLE